MTRRQKAWILVGIFIAATLGALSGYFYGQARLRRWARPAAERDCHDFRDAPDYIGEAGCVEGRILDVYTSGRGNSFLNFCVNYQDCPFNAVIFSEDMKKFGNLTALLGRQVQISGLIEIYKGQAEIKIRDPVQIRVEP